MRNLLWTFLLLWAYTAIGQVKVGDNINTIDASSILELESANKAFVPTRMNTAQMNAITPLNGAMVYNTDAQCIYVFNSAMWRSLCNSEISVTSSITMPTTNMIGDFWFNEMDEKASVWNGTNWILITQNPKSGNGVPDATTVANPIVGDIYVNQIDGSLFTYDGSSWNNNSSVTAANGITKTAANSVELGGSLNKPTTIVSDATNTLAIEGLETSTDLNNLIVTTNPTTGVLTKTPQTSLVQKEEVLVIAIDGQNQFNTPLTITNPKKIDVYRNGVKIDFNAVGTNIIELETSVICFQNDEIRIVQFF